MQRSNSSTEADGLQMKAHQISRSFKRLEPTNDSPLSRNPGSTYHKGYEAGNFDLITSISPSEPEIKLGNSVFTTGDGDKLKIPDNVDQDIEVDNLAETFEELPANVRSLTEKFLESLSAKIHPTPFSADLLSQLFQDFYLQADLKLSEHVTRLAAKSSREASPAPSVSSRSSGTSKGRAQAGSASRSTDTITYENGSEQQLLTTSEIASKRKARKVLEIKKAAYEEAVERLVCAKVYNRIWRHRSTDDQERDQKLQSRAEALALVGIGLKELHLGSSETDQKTREVLVKKEEKICEWIREVTEDLVRMNDKHYPLGKLQHLVMAHKSIVKILSQLFPSSSSADEILPMLIYALVTSQCERLNVISNLNFIQRFRASDKLSGEAAYCLVNLEAAISFLETVDLPSLRAEEAQTQAGSITNAMSTSELAQDRSQHDSKLADEYFVGESLQNTSDASSTEKRISLTEVSSNKNSQGRFSNILQNQTHRLEAVRGDLLDSADQAFDNISNTLDSSFNFLFGRLREQAKKDDAGNDGNLLPKTLEDARKLVGTPPPMDDDNDSVSGVSFSTEKSPASKDKLIGKQDINLPDSPVEHRLRTETSNDSMRRTANSKRSAKLGALAGPPSHYGGPQHTTFQLQGPTSAPTQATAGNAAVESMKTLGNTLNPLKGFSNMSIMPRFGRGIPSSSSEVSPSHIESNKDHPAMNSPTSLRMVEELKRSASPSQKFLNVQDASELRIKDVEELLKDYRRLAIGINKVTKG